MVRLGDTSLLAEVEHDFATTATSSPPGAASACATARVPARGTYASGALDMVVQNATVIDAVAGIVKGDIGIRDGKIVAIGKAGIRLMNGVDPRLRCGPNTDGRALRTASSSPRAGIEAHAHFLSPQQCHHALARRHDDHDRHVAGPHSTSVAPDRKYSAS